MILLDVAKLLKKRGYDEVPTEELVNVLRDAFTAIAGEAVAKAEEFILQIPKFGSFKIIRRKARKGHNPKTGEAINIPEQIVLKFKPSNKVKEKLSQVKLSKAKAKPKAKAKTKDKAKSKKK